jgi:hypothetical protein
MEMATIETTDGNELAAGLVGCDNDYGRGDALRAAERHADNIGADVVLHDDDGSWLVHPADSDGSRAAADDISAEAGE